MGMRSKNPRSIYKPIRFTEDEWAQIQAGMETDGYLSFSRYVRDIIIRKRIVVNREVSITDRSLKKQINDITAQISKIGTNYNQFVTRYNSMCNTKTNKGTPVVSTRATIRHIESLERLTESLIGKVNLLITTTEKTDLLNKED